jgi:hypothetical protein
MSTPKLSTNQAKRLDTIKKVIGDKEISAKIESSYAQAKGNWTAAVDTLKTDGLDEVTLGKLDLAHALADLTGNHTELVKAIAGQPNVASMRDVALNNDAASIAAMIKPKQVPVGTPGDTAHQKVNNFATSLHDKLFASQTSAVLQRMAETAVLPIADAGTRTHIATFLNNQPEFNIRKTSVYNAINEPDAFKDIPEESHQPVISQLKTLQRVQAISPTPAAVTELMKANISTAQQVAEMTPKDFQKKFGATLGADTAAMVHNNALSIKVRNEHALMAIKDSVQGTGIAAIDGTRTKEDRALQFNDLAGQNKVPVNWEGLFGNVDLCECEDCNSVYGPASYFVELLNYLRNNNLDPDNANTGAAGIGGTPLEILFRRRPDLGCLELTCANANTVMPYIDIVNEIMESFITHEAQYDVDTNTPKQLTLDVWNVEDESSADLLATPQHTNYNAYCVLKNAVYPFTLPYHQPIDAIRIFLNFLNSSRYELMKTFQSVTEADINNGLPTPGNPPGPNDAELTTLIETAIRRGTDAEFLGLTQEEYIILTKQAFWEARYFVLTCGQPFTDQQYLDKIKGYPTYQYYGYHSDEEMTSLDESLQLGLTFVKKQFLPRTGILYTDLVSLLETQYINPYMPQGQALDIMDSLTFSYRFLQTLVTTPASDPNRYAKLITYLQNAQLLVPALQALLHPDPCHQNCTCDTISCEELACWVKCYFENIGKLIVLDSGDGPTLPFSGTIVNRYDNLKNNQQIPGNPDNWELNKYGQIYLNNILTGSITATGNTIGTDGKPLPDPYDPTSLFQGTVFDSGGRRVGRFQDAVLYDTREYKSDATENNRPPVVQWLPTSDSCDISKVRLIHLDGSSVTPAEYDKMQRFLRLWKKMGWTMDETDKATMGLGAPPVVPPGQHVPVAGKDCFNEFTDDCSKGTTTDCGCGTTEECGCSSNYADGLLNCDITPAYLHQLVYVNKLLDSTGLDLVTLLTFWTDISTIGDNSQYKQLFLRYNLLAVDTVFQADKYGNYLTAAAKITDHIPVIMAAFNLKAADIANIMQYENIADSLTLANISMIYRYSLLMRLLNIKSSSLQDVKSIFGDPFIDAQHTEKFIENWGKMEDYGFTFAQLDYVLNNVDDPNRPLKPTFISFLKLAKTFYDGLNAIMAANPDVNTQDDAVPTATVPVVATPELATTSIALLFTPAVTTQIMALLQGTTVYSTNAPINLVATAADFTALLTGTLIQKIKYDYVNGGVQVNGILTTAETEAAKALFITDSFWAEAIDRLNLQPREFFNDVLYGIITNPADQATILEGDYNIPPSQQPDQQNIIPDTAPVKLFCFMKAFMPFLRERLMHTFIVSTLSTQTGLNKDVTDMLISNILVSGTPALPIVEIFKNINNAYQPAAGSWSGYLIPTGTDVYTFAITVQTNMLNAAISVNGQALNFTQQADPNNVYLSDPIKLQAGKAYKFLVTGLDINLTGLAWKTPTTPKSAIPASAMLVDDLTDDVTTAYVQLQKAGIIASVFGFSDAEINYLQQNGADFGNLDFNAITFQTWLRLGAYTQLRNSLPPTNLSLLQFFAWTKQTTDTTNLSAQIVAATNWLQSDVDKLLAAGHFNLVDNNQFVNEIKLLKLQQALYVAANITIDINLLFSWAKPVSKFWVCHDIAESIRKSIKARYNETDWEQVVKPLNDQLREHQRDALISYLLVQPDLKEWGVIDANSLFEFFLIDVQMDSCMETSRIKQGTLSIQLFVQRCFLGLEEPYIDNDVLDAKRWEWMQYNNVWVANRKVFLYPENWIVESLRDDKSDFYKALESQLLQKDINTQNVQDALNSYLFQVDDVANMQALGIFVEEGVVKDATVPVKYHIFSRTRNAPYFFYYRYFDVIESNWYPWEQVQVDITNYDIEGPSTGQVFGNGAFLTPVVWNGRLLIFFPQIIKKVVPATTSSASYSGGGASGSVPHIQWEIKMAWSEYRNGKWTQKQVSTDAMYHSGSDLTAATLPNISAYSFVAYVDTSDQNVQIIPCWGDSLIDVSNVFMFQGSTISVAAGTSNFNPATSASDFNAMRFQSVNSSGTYTTYPLQYNGSAEPYLEASAPYVTDNISAVSIESSAGYDEFYQPFSHQLLGVLASETSGDLTDFFSSNLTLPNDADEAFGSYFDSSLQVTSYSELKTPYAIYNWELFFHAPATIAGKLSSAQQFQAAKQWYEYIFNPAAPGPTPQRAWQFYPFQQINADNYLEYLFNMLKSNTGNDDINAWRSNPFEPHLIARGRPVAYMKWIVMQYMDNLIAWGDYLFTQHTLETINQATQLYILAYHIMGPRPQLIPKRGKVLPETYNSLLNKWDAFGNAMVELELAFPFSNQIDTPIGIGKDNIGFANIFGFATSLYFCLPSNPELTAYWDTLDDRLGKIRACENIEGVFGLPPLWDPPIDPALLVQATAQGLSISSVLNDLNSPVPNYRFYYLMQKALELCNELKSLGSNLLSAFEKGDGETLASMRASQESTMQNMIMQVKQLQLNEANTALEGLNQNRETPAYRMQHYLDLIGQDAGKIPGADADFTALAGPPQSLVTDSELILTSYEKQEMDKASNAKDLQEGVGIVETLAGVLHLLPLLAADVKPIGVGAGLSFGGDQLGSALGAVARGMQVGVGNLNAESAAARSKGGYLRQLQDRVLQANLAGFEIKQIDKQILSQQIRISITNQEITNQQQAIDNAVQTLDFLTNKYTNQQLYSWMKDTLKNLYYQVYTLAYGLAQKAEKVYRFERGLSSSNFIQFGYWDASHDGLLAGENLYVGLKQLEAAYQQDRGYDFEISKKISLRQIDPIALLTLRSTGACKFELPEVLFDMDFPGHYMRRIKSVALSVPCIAGPYTGINASLRMTQNTFRQNTMPGSAYPQDTTKDDPRFMTVNVPITSVAVSHGQNDSGVFELNFKDERYMPFEGAGVISQWSLSLPEFKQIDYNTITDVIMTVRYTSIDGGDKQKKAANTYLNGFVKNVQNLSQNEGLFAIFDLKNDLPNEWYKATQLPPAADGREISLATIVDRLPVYTKASAPDKIIAQDIYVLTEAGIASGDILINQGTNPQNVVSHGFGGGVNFKPMHVFTAPGVNINMQNWTLAISNTAVPLNNMWMVVRYTLN